TETADKQTDETASDSTDDTETGDDSTAEGGEKKKIDILSITFTGTPAEDDEPTILALEELTGYDIEVEYLLNANYEDQLNTRMAAGNLPALVVLTGKTASVISYCRAGAFW